MSAAAERVPLSQLGNLLVPGAPLPFNVLDGHGRLLLAAGQRIQDVEQLRALLERGASVTYAEVESVRKVRAVSAQSGGALTPSARRKTWFDRWEALIWQLDTLTKALGRDPSQAAGLRTAVDDTVALVDRHPDAALFMCIRQDDRRFALYALVHGLHTATLALMAGRQLGWAAERCRAVVGAALTMNAPIADLQGQLAEQTEPPTKKQVEQIRAHPAKAAELLRASGIDEAEWLQAVEDHHERAGPGGYPRGIEAIGEPARLLRAADVFMAKISPRAGRAPMLPQLAARQLFQEESGGLIAAALIKAIGVYPPGDFVLLKSGEQAIVVQRAAPGQAAQAAVLMAANGKPVAGGPRRDTSQPEYAITGPVIDRKGLTRVLPEAIYGIVDAGA